MKKLIAIIILLSLTSCSRTHKTNPINFNGVEGQVLRVVNYYNEFKEPNNYLVAIKLSNKTSKEIDINDLRNSISLVSDSFEAKGSITIHTYKTSADILYPNEEEIILFDFLFESGIGDNDSFGFKYKEKNHYFTNLNIQNGIPIDFMTGKPLYFTTDENILYENNKLKVEIFPQDFDTIEFTSSLAGNMYSVKNAAAYYTNKTNDFLFVPIVQAKGKIINNEEKGDSKHTYLDFYSFFHNFTAEHQKNNKEHTFFLLLKPHEEIHINLSHSFIISGSHRNDFLDKGLALDFKYFILYNSSDSVNYSTILDSKKISIIEEKKNLLRQFYLKKRKQ